jgi:hypothetical protein
MFRLSINSSSSMTMLVSMMFLANLRIRLDWDSIRLSVRVWSLETAVVIVPSDASDGHRTTGIDFNKLADGDGWNNWAMQLTGIYLTQAKNPGMM